MHKLEPPQDNSDKLGRNCRVWARLATARTKLILSKLADVSQQQLSRINGQTQQCLLYYALDVSAHTRFTTAAEPNLYSDLEKFALERAAELGHRLRHSLPSALTPTDRSNHMNIDWTSKIGYFLLRPGAESGCDTPVLKHTVTGEFYRAPGFVTTANMKTFSISNNWSAADATLNDGVREVNITAYIAGRRALQASPPEPLTPPVRQPARPSPKSGNKPTAIRVAHGVSGRKQKPSAGRT